MIPKWHSKVDAKNLGNAICLGYSTWVSDWITVVGQLSHMPWTNNMERSGRMLTVDGIINRREISTLSWNLRIPIFSREWNLFLHHAQQHCFSTVSYWDIYPIGMSGLFWAVISKNKFWGDKNSNHLPFAGTKHHPAPIPLLLHQPWLLFADRHFQGGVQGALKGSGRQFRRQLHSGTAAPLHLVIPGNFADP